MKRITAIALFAMASFALAGKSFAQNHKVQATVPFDFTVAGKLLPAGTYLIKKQDNTDVIVIANLDKPISALGLVNPDSNKSHKGGKLTFHKYGDQYFLSEILCDSADVNVQMPTTKKEEKVRLQQARLGASQTFVATR
jgi:hypothetical protein